MKKIFVLIIVLFIVLLTGCSLFKYKEDDKHLMRRIKFDISTCEIKESIGYYGDGEYVLIADCSKKDDTIEYFEAWNKLPVSSKINDWNQLPLSDNMESLIYGNHETSSKLKIKEYFPKVTSGYYYFINRNEKAKSKIDEKELVEDMRNFTISIFDNDTKILYYYEYDK